MVRAKARLVLAVVALAVTGAVAQEKPPDTPAELEAQTPMEDPANAVPQDRYVDTAQASVASMRATLSKGLDRLKKARDAQDAVELVCVNEKVTTMKGILRVAEGAVVALEEAL